VIWPFSKRKKETPKEKKEMGFGGSIEAVSREEADRKWEEQKKKLRAREIKLYPKRRSYYLYCPRLKKELNYNRCLECEYQVPMGITWGEDYKALLCTW